MRTIDRIFGWLMVAFAVFQCAALLKNYWHVDPAVAVFAVGTGLAQLFLGAMNLVRAERRHDLTVARLCVFGNLLWMALLILYMAVNHAVIQLLPLGNLAVVLALLLLSLRSRRRSRPM